MLNGLLFAALTQAASTRSLISSRMWPDSDFFSLPLSKLFERKMFIDIFIVEIVVLNPRPTDREFRVTTARKNKTKSLSEHLVIFCINEHEGRAKFYRQTLTVEPPEIAMQMGEIKRNGIKQYRLVNLFVFYVRTYSSVLLLFIFMFCLDWS